MMWSSTETATHTFPVRVVGPNNAWEHLFNTSGETMVSRCRRIDDNNGPGCNIWLTKPITLLDIESIYPYLAAMTLNTTLLKRMILLRAEWSRK